MNLSYVWLLSLSGILILLGIGVLVVAIPGFNILFKSSDAKTEFHSVAVRRTIFRADDTG